MATDRLAGGGLRPQPGYDIARKLVYNWASVTPRKGGAG